MAEAETGASMAVALVTDRLEDDPANWGEYSGTVEIRSPEKYAGRYEVGIDWEPEVWALKL